MNKLYMGIDSGSVSTKAVIIDEYDNIIASYYIYTEGNPIKAAKKVISKLKEDIDLDRYKVVGVGTTGSARKLVGTMLDAVVIRNEIIAQVTGAVSICPGVRTIIEIGGQDSKIILVNNCMAVDYAINSLCGAGTGAFIDSICTRLNICLDDISGLVLKSKNDIDVLSNCMIFAETYLISKLQQGYKIEDIVSGICKGIAKNYLNSVANGKKICEPIIFTGGVSKNNVIVNAIEKMIGKKIIVNKNSHLIGAIGVAILARESKLEKEFNFDVDKLNIETRISSCDSCSNNCKIVAIYKNDDLVDYWGNRCDSLKKIKNV